MAKRNNLILSIFLITISIFLLLGINKTIKDHHDRQYTVVYNKIKEDIENGKEDICPSQQAERLCNDKR